MEFTDKAFVINGFSKLYAMTGWRLGYCIFPKQFSKVMQRIHQNFMISANGFIQQAGIAALTKAKKDVDKMVKTYDERRRYMLARLKDMGFVIHVEPTGVFARTLIRKLFVLQNRLKSVFRLALISAAVVRDSCASPMPILWKTSKKA